MQEYTKCLVDSLKLFFKKFENHLKDCVAYDNQSLKEVTFKKEDTSEVILILFIQFLFFKHLCCHVCEYHRY